MDLRFLVRASRETITFTRRDMAAFGQLMNWEKIDMDVTGKHSRWSGYRQFRLRSALVVITACCLAARFGPSAWQWAFPPTTLPSAYYLSGGVQYFAPGPEFKLSQEQEAAAMKADRADAKEKSP